MSSRLQGRYALEPGRSQLRFRATAFLLMPVTGTFSARAGELDISDGSMSATGTADSGSVSTGIGLRDRHLRHRHYLNAREHPVITLAVRGASARTGPVSAKLTVRGVTVEVPLIIDRFDADGSTVAVTAHGAFDRVLIGMLPPLAGVSRRIHIELELVFVVLA